MKKNYVFIVVVSMLLSLASIGCVFYYKNNQIHYGFLNTEKLLNSFVESQKAMDQLKKEDDAWQKKEDSLKDSLVVFESRMNLSYEKMSVNEKKKVRQEQIELLEGLNNLKKARNVSLQKMRTEKLQSVYTKINSALSDYAALKKIDLIFASSNGSIVYGNGSPADLTDDFLVFLNKRFE